MFERRECGKVDWRECVNVEEILCGNVGVGEDGGGNRQSVFPNESPGGDVGTDVGRCSPGEETDRILREELGSANITSTPKRVAWPIYNQETQQRVGQAGRTTLQSGYV